MAGEDDTFSPILFRISFCEVRFNVAVIAVTTR